MRLALNLTTRGRPERMLDTVTRTLPMMTRRNTKLLISVDDDDDATLRAIPFLPKDKRVTVSVKPREDALGEKYNRVLRYPADVYMSMADYGAVVTPGFDDKILAAAALFPDNIGCVFGPMANASFSNLYGVTAGLVKKMGWLYPPYFPFWFVDHWVDDVARLIDRIAYAEVQIDYSGKPPTQELRDLQFWTTVFDVCRLVRRDSAHKIIRSKEFKEPKWRKALLLQHHPLTEYRSQNINDYIRTNADAMETSMNAGPGGARYERLKTKAMEMLMQLSPAMLSEIQIAA